MSFRTFDTFIVTETSRVPFAAALAVAENPAGAHNPLFLHGPTGSGKSHLLQAIEHTMRSRRPNAKIVRLSADVLIARLVDAIRFDDMTAFRQSLAVDALLIDDLPLDDDKPHTREEIFRSLEHALTQRAQIVVASSHSVRTSSRVLFERARIVGMGSPDQAVKIQIAQSIVARFIAPGTASRTAAPSLRPRA